MALDKLVFATHNKGKIKELEKMISGHNIKVFSANDISITEAEETGETFVENALIKAELAAKETNMPALADDSGFCLMGLDGAPGVYSARSFDVKEKGYSQAFDRIYEILKEKNDFRASFECVLALAFPDGEHKIFKGMVKGKFTYPKKGDNGFGYDPVFTPDGYNETFAEMNNDLKNELSHRGLAFKQFIKEML